MAYLKEEIKAGIIIFASLIILSGFIILIGGSQLFEKLDVYYVKVMNAAGLESGAQVKLGGVRVGSVLDIKAPDGPGEPVTIAIGIKRGTALYKGTKALITQVGFVGDIYLLLSVEETTNERFTVGDIIPSVESVDFKILMAKVDVISESVDRLIKDIDKLFSQSNIKDIEKLVKNTNKAIVSASSNLDKVTTTLVGTVNKLEISKLINKTSEDLEKAGDMIKAVEETAKMVGKTSESVEEAIDLQSQNITNLLNTLTETTEDLQEVLQEIKNKPWSVIYPVKESQ